MPKQSGVYRIDLGNERFYVGSSIDLHQREARHLSQLKGRTHPNRIMQRTFDKYGVFEFTIVQCCVTDELLTREQALLDAHFDNVLCVNLAPNAGSSLGTKHSFGTRAKMSMAHKGRTFSPEHRAKISAANLNRAPISDETRAKMRAAWKTRAPASEETRAKLSAAGLGRKHSLESRAKMSAVKQNMSLETRAKMSAARRKRGPISEETRARMSEAQRNRSPEHQAKLTAAQRRTRIMKKDQQ